MKITAQKPLHEPPNALISRRTARKKRSLHEVNEHFEHRATQKSGGAAARAKVSL